MTVGYIELPVTTDPNALVQTALSNIAAKLPGWVPREGNLEVLLLEEMAQFAAEAASVASDVQESIFKYFGSLVNVTPNLGVKAQISTTWQFVTAPTSNVTYVAGTIGGFTYNGASYQFELDQDLVVTAGTPSVSGVIMSAIAAGQAYNLSSVTGLNPFSTYMYLLGSDPNLSFIKIDADNTNDATLALGQDPETDQAFLARLAAELQLLAPRPITPNDYALFAENVSGVNRALAIDGYNPFTNMLSGGPTTPGDSDFTYLANATAPTSWAAIGHGNTTLPTLSVPSNGVGLNYLNVASATMPTAPTFVSYKEAGLVFAITAIAASAGTVTYTCINTLVAGDVVTITGCPTSAYNLTGVTVASASGSQFTVTNAATGATCVGTCLQLPHQLTLTTTTLVAATSHPTPMLLVGPAFSEVVLATTVGTTVSGQRNTCLASPLVHASSYTSGNVATVLQGAYQINAAAQLYANSPWYQAATVTQRGASSTGTPLIAALATYADNSTCMYSSIAEAWNASSTGSLGLDYASPDRKMEVANIASVNSVPSVSPLIVGPPAHVPYDTLAQEIISIQLFVLWFGAGNTSNDRILYNSIQQVDFDLAPNGIESPSLDNSSYNWLPDSALASYQWAQGITSSWQLGTGMSALPNIGFKYTGAGASTALSPVVNITDMTQTSGVQVSGGTKGYTLIGHFDASQYTTYTAAGNDTITLKIINKRTSTDIASALLSTANSGVGFVYVPFSMTTFDDVQVEVLFGSSVSIPNSGSVVVSQISLMSGSGRITPPTNYQSGPSWTEGGHYNGAGTFNSPRSVAVVPLDVAGFPIDSSSMNNLLTYLQESREANFLIGGLTPNFVAVNVAWAAIAGPGYVPADLVNIGNAAIDDFLSPANWGGGDHTPPTWDGTAKTVQAYDIAAVLGNIDGIVSVSSVGLSQGTSTGVGVSNIVVASTTATATTIIPHGFYNGQQITVTNSGVSGLNLAGVTITVVDPYTFTYTVQGGTGNSNVQSTATPTLLGSLSLLGTAPLPIANYISGVVSPNPNDALVGIL